VAVLCVDGIKGDGRKVLLHRAVGDKESTVCWKSFFQDMKGRGLAEPLLAIADGNSGLRKTVRECFPDAWVQRCQVHRVRNILCKLPEKARPGLKKLIEPDVCRAGGCVGQLARGQGHSSVSATTGSDPAPSVRKSVTWTRCLTRHLSGEPSRLLYKPDIQNPSR